MEPDIVLNGPVTEKGFRGEYAFLSNFYPTQIVFKHLDSIWTVPTAEHAFQCLKTLDWKEVMLVANTATPGRAKQAGRYVTLREGWDQERINVMAKILSIKFDPEINPKNVELLLATGDTNLVEYNHHGDTFWGYCNGKGENILGNLLMFIRAQLRAEKEKPHEDTNKT